VPGAAAIGEPVSEHIDRAKLARAKPEAVVRLAKALRIHGCACGATECQQDIQEKVARRLAAESMARHAGRSVSPARLGPP